MSTYNELKNLYYTSLEKNNVLKNHIYDLRNLLCSDICKYFEFTNSIHDTKKRFCYDNYYDCYIDLCYFYGSDQHVRHANDFKQYYEDIFGKPYPKDESPIANDKCIDK